MEKPKNINRNQYPAIEDTRPAKVLRTPTRSNMTTIQIGKTSVEVSADYRQQLEAALADARRHAARSPPLPPQPFPLPPAKFPPQPPSPTAPDEHSIAIACYPCA
jgi:hypothetical protein